MNANNVGRSPHRPIFKANGFDMGDKKPQNSKLERDVEMTMVYAAARGICKRPVIESYLVGTSGIDMASESQHTTMSHVEGDVDRWIHGSEGPRSLNSLKSTAIQSSKIAVAQRSTLTSQSRLTSAGWYICAVFLSFLNFLMHTLPGSNCSTSRSVTNAFVLLHRQVRICYRFLSVTLPGLFQDHGHVTTSHISTVLDVILFVYAITFLVLAMVR